MNRNFKVITINGIRGMITLVFIVLGLIAGFVISPGWACMQIWNHIFEESNTIAMMNLFEGIILWAIIALVLYAVNNRKPLIGFGSYQGLSPEQIKEIMQRARQSEVFNTVKDFEIMKKETVENKEQAQENSEATPEEQRR